MTINCLLYNLCQNSQIIQVAITHLIKLNIKYNYVELMHRLVCVLMVNYVCLHMVLINLCYINQYLKLKNVEIIILMDIVDLVKDVISDMKKMGNHERKRIIIDFIVY